jgi:hypothetical protein
MRNIKQPTNIAVNYNKQEHHQMAANQQPTSQQQ